MFNTDFLYGGEGRVTILRKVPGYRATVRQDVVIDSKEPEGRVSFRVPFSFFVILFFGA